MAALSCNHLWLNTDTWPEPRGLDLSQCPWCTYIPTRHRGFFRVQLGNLNMYDKVMKEMKCRCGRKTSQQGRKQPGGAISVHTDDTPFHLQPERFPADASSDCPCVLSGRLSDECRYGCKCKSYRLGDTIAYAGDE